MAWGMLPCLGSAMCACTWHLFYNSEDLQVRYCLFHMRSSCQCIVPHGVCLQSCSRAGRAKTFELRVVCAVAGADVWCLCRLNFTPFLAIPAVPGGAAGWTDSGWELHLLVGGLPHLPGGAAAAGMRRGTAGYKD